MISSTYKLFILLTCIGMLAVEPYMVYGFRNIDIEIRWKKANHGELPVNNRVLKEVSVEDLQAKPSPSSLHKKLDPNQSSKRTVRRGSDPIHNRS